MPGHRNRLAWRTELSAASWTGSIAESIATEFPAEHTTVIVATTVSLKKTATLLSVPIHEAAAENARISQGFGRQP
jgi:hypothetical protein